MNRQEIVLLRRLFIVAVCFLLCFFAIDCVFHGASFDSERWKESGKFDRLGVRRRMWRDLINNGGLVGKSPSEVLQLLGPPNAEFWKDSREPSTSDAAEVQRNGSYEYSVGGRILSPMTVVHIDISFTDGRVSSVGEIQ